MSKISPNITLQPNEEYKIINNYKNIKNNI